MPRYQAVIEFWAYRDSHADDAVRQSLQTIDALTRNTVDNAQKEGVATGDIEIKSILSVTPLDPSDYVAMAPAEADFG